MTPHKLEQVYLSGKLNAQINYLQKLKDEYGKKGYANLRIEEHHWYGFSDAQGTDYYLWGDRP